MEINLTEEQKLKLDQYIEKWVEIAVSTEPTDRKKAEEAINYAYHCAGFLVPKKIFWSKSPIANAMLYAFCSNIEKSPIPLDFNNENDLCFINQCIENIVNIVFLKEEKIIGDSNVEQVMKFILSQEVKEYALASLNECRYGQQDAHWICLYDFLREEIGEIESTNELLGLFETTKNCGWFIPTENGYCFASERLTNFHKDSENNLHNEEGIALGFADNFGVYSVNGVRVPPYIILHPDKITIDDIENTTNLEVKRIKIDKYGMARYIENSNAEIVNEDKYGILYRKDQGEDEPICMVKVKNSTAEPDGTYKMYFLSVPPECKTAHEAVAWTFGKEAKDYHPDVET